MKKAFSKIILVLFILVILGSTASVSLTASATEPAKVGLPSLTGTYITSDMYDNLSKSQLEDRIKWLKSYGIEYIVLKDVFTIKSNNIISYGYDTKINYLIENGKKKSNYIESLLQVCDKAGIKVFLGLGDCETWDEQNIATSKGEKWFNELCSLSGDVATDLYDQLGGKHQSFYGFYFVPQFYNNSGIDIYSISERYASIVSTGFNSIIESLNKIDRDIPFMFSFYAHTKDYASKDNSIKFFTDFLSKTNFRNNDIFCFSNNKHLTDIEPEDFQTWMIAYQQCISDYYDTTGISLSIYGSADSYKSREAEEAKGPLVIDEFYNDISYVWSYCDKIFVDSLLGNYYPRNNVNNYDIALRHCLTKGPLSDDEAKDSISEVTKVKTELSDDGTSLVFSFNNAPTKYGVYGYNIYKYNSSTEMYEYLVHTREYNYTATEGQTSDISITVPGYTDSKYNAYRIVTFDCFGNASSGVYVPVYQGKPDNGVNLNSNDGETGILSENDMDVYLGRKTPAPTPIRDTRNKGAITFLSIVIIPIFAVITIFIICYDKVLGNSHHSDAKNKSNNG